VSLDVVLIVIGAVICLSAALPLRTRLPRPAVEVLAAAGGALIGLGAIGLQDGASTFERVLVPVVLAALAPLHVRLLFAGEGPRRI
jgi:hypothetical protein